MACRIATQGCNDTRNIVAIKETEKEEEKKERKSIRYTQDIPLAPFFESRGARIRSSTDRSRHRGIYANPE